MKKELNKWQFRCGLTRDYRYLELTGWHIFEIYLVKLLSFPPEGAMLGKDNYKGFIFRFKFWLPIDTA